MIELLANESSPPSTNESAKALGAFYTSIQIADFLVWWAIRTSRDSVMDPSFGGGVFIRSACNRLIALGGKPEHQVFGVELDAKVHRLIGSKLKEEFRLNSQNLRQQDFFEFEPLPVNQVNAVVGNPPFIRFHRFVAEVRKRALTQAADHGVQLTQLSSSWAPFVIHSISMLKRGGRLALVLPMEMSHATYALPVMKFLLSSFGRVTLLTFRKKLFPTLSEDTLLLLAEDKGARFSAMLHRDLAHAGALADIQKANRRAITATRRLDASSLADGGKRLIEYLIPKRTRELYQQLKHSQVTSRLGELADIGIGYVTGANDFFHLSPRKAEAMEIPKRFLRPAVRRGRALSGLRFTDEDWKAAVYTGDAGYLLSISRQDDLPTSVRRYLEQGKKQRIPDAYKCRVRSPWYSVPHVYQPDAFLTYMSGITPRLVTNDAQVVAPNTLHVVRLHPQASHSAHAIAALWPSSLTRLSVEIEGHSLGGGMLKLEPSEAENCVVATPDVSEGGLHNLAKELDLLKRSGKETEAQDRADEFILRRGLGLSHKDCILLREAGELLFNRRSSRSGT
jgi:adenine-specific DNA-methyltransferase